VLRRRSLNSVLAQLVGDARLAAAEKGEVEVYGGTGAAGVAESG